MHMRFRANELRQLLGFADLAEYSSEIWDIVYNLLVHYGDPKEYLETFFRDETRSGVFYCDS